MPLTLHAATVPAWLQVIASTHALVDKAEAWCDENGHDHGDILDASLAENMWSFNWQVSAVWMHSAHALAAAESGMFEPDFSAVPDSFEACRAKLDTARDFASSVDPQSLEEWADNNLDFVLGGTTRMSFTVQNFLLSFSNPNFYFHAAAIYDILRMKGLEIGKRDFLGAVAIKQ
ncbi:DUF1993 domain-containing protein [Pontixanthobacter aestiaquae]|uniref:DUF1993 family protein n=1 Tax=Pontixanthobacter aestiaquae TaxID=1509367 RepID=A0A844ZB57_9SPHN|nr:DUF1993 domain-containing protein [Pontixanthobacter aestiaquae]MDN3644736.1 DUF1993 domain-containing protein [Pontixanthobacter aestiaquae]MXO84257.1 DUF1993 family protein [Pontixanthobacter aestiaquae]